MTKNRTDREVTLRGACMWALASCIFAKREGGRKSSTELCKRYTRRLLDTYRKGI